MKKEWAFYGNLIFYRFARIIGNILWDYNFFCRSYYKCCASNSIHEVSYVMVLKSYLLAFFFCSLYIWGFFVSAEHYCSFKYCFSLLLPPWRCFFSPSLLQILLQLNKKRKSEEVWWFVISLGIRVLLLRNMLLVSLVDKNINDIF